MCGVYTCTRGYSPARGAGVHDGRWYVLVVVDGSLGQLDRRHERDGGVAQDDLAVVQVHEREDALALPRVIARAGAYQGGVAEGLGEQQIHRRGVSRSAADDRGFSSDEALSSSIVQLDVASLPFGIRPGRGVRSRHGLV